MLIKTGVVHRCAQITCSPMAIPAAVTLDTSWLPMGRTAVVRRDVKARLAIYKKIWPFYYLLLDLHACLLTSNSTATGVSLYMYA